MNVRRTAEVLDTVSRILREIPADVLVLGIILNAGVMSESYNASVHLASGGATPFAGLTTLAEFYGVKIQSDRRPGSKFTRYSITVDGVELFILKKEERKG